MQHISRHRSTRAGCCDRQPGLQQLPFAQFSATAPTQIAVRRGA